MNRFIAALAIFSALTTTACGSSMQIPDIKQNPHPKMRYELTITIHDAPGRVEAISGQMQFAVTNEECAPKHPISGAHLTPSNQYVPFVIKPVADRIYAGTVHLDFLQDEDYYGKGICHWALSHAGIELKIDESTFGTSITSKSIVMQQASTEYLLKAPPPPGRRDTGIPAGTPASEYATQHPQEFFSVTLTAKEVFQ